MNRPAPALLTFPQRRVDSCIIMRVNLPEIRLSAVSQFTYNSTRGSVWPRATIDRILRRGALAQRNDQMNRSLSRFGVAACAVLAAGCISPQDTRLPTLGYRDTRTERQSFNYLNPLPDRSGPGYHALPRGFDYPLAETPRAQERAAITEEITGGGTNPPSKPSLSRYSRS